MSNRIAVYEGFEGRRRKRRRSGGGSAQRRKFSAAAKACKGQGQRAFRACMRNKLSK